MCLGIPGRVMDIHPDDTGMLWGSVELDGIRRRVCLSCVPDAEPGDYVIVHAGLAISRIDAAEAGKVFDLVRTLEHTDGWADGT